MIYEFSGFAVDSGRFELSREGQPIGLQPQAMRLLQALLAADGRLVTKQQIVLAIWDGRAISDSALSSQIKALRKALDDTARPYGIIGTVHGEGFRILCPIERREDRVPAMPVRTDAAPVAREREQADPRGSKAAIAVLPFRLIGRTDRAALLAEALPDEILTALSRLRMLHVIARGSSFQYSRSDTQPAQLRAQLGAQYALSGSIEPVGEDVIISVELDDTASESVVWAERFTVPPAGVHEVRAEIAGRIAAEAEQQIPRNEADRLRLKVPDSLTAWESFHLGMSHLQRRGRENMFLAQGHFQRAVEIDPGFSRAYSGLSHTHWWLVLQRTLTDTAASERAMMEHARAAFDHDPYDPAAYLAMGRAHSLLEDQQSGLDFLDRAVDLAPSYAWAHNQLAAIRAFTGPHDKAIGHGMTALALSPRDPLRHSMYAALAVAHLNKGEVEQAAEWGRKAQTLPHRDLMVMVTALCTNHIAGYKDEAAAIAQRVRDTFPGLNAEGIARANPMMQPENIALTSAIMEKYGIG